MKSSIILNKNIYLACHFKFIYIKSDMCHYFIGVGVTPNKIRQVF
jgi:hypothetical protein